MVRRRRPVRVDNLRAEGRELGRYEALTMPPSSDGHAVDILFGSMAPLGAAQSMISYL